MLDVTFNILLKYLWNFMCRCQIHILFTILEAILLLWPLCCWNFEHLCKSWRETQFVLVLFSIGSIFVGDLIIFVKSLGDRFMNFALVSILMKFFVFSKTISIFRTKVYGTKRWNRNLKIPFLAHFRKLIADSNIKNRIIFSSILKKKIELWIYIFLFLRRVD